MLTFISILICASACALPSSIITQGADKINLQSSKELTLPSGRRSDVVGIVGGNVTTIDVYPYAVIILWAAVDNTMTWFCSGTILNNRSVLTAARCKTKPENLRFRVGSSMAFSGGTVHTLDSFIVPRPNPSNFEDNDIAIVRSATSIVYTANTVQPAVTAGADYNLPDNEPVWALGWGVTNIMDNVASDQLRHVQIFTINQRKCIEHYNEHYPGVITVNMLCAGVLDVWGKDFCEGDQGAPLVHNGVVVGVYSFGLCGNFKYPGVSTRVSRFANWIEKNK